MYKFFIIILIVLGLGVWIGKMEQPKAEKAELGVVTSLPKKAEKIEVLVFHATSRCISCINIGKYSKAVIEEKFQRELNSGRITFREVNIDLPENFKMAQDYGVSGSALFINAIKDGKDNHEEDTTVWRLVANEAQMKSYFEAKLKSLL